MNWFSEPKTNHYEWDWEPEPWDDKTWRRIVLILGLAVALWLLPRYPHKEPVGQWEKPCAATVIDSAASTDGTTHVTFSVPAGCGTVELRRARQ
jgi:hypothetical protein